MPRLLNQRGLSLLEVMIILVVVGLLLGGSLVPLGAILRGDAYDAEEREMRRFHDAIVGYAITHRTRERFLEVEMADQKSRPFTLPGDRPYLPCPDSNGDGYEDRNDFDANGLGGPLEGITMTISGNLPDDNDLLDMGGCVSPRGILPWRTLGVQPHDRWGNRYTYEVDEIFSNAMVGFDETMDIDSFDIRRMEVISSVDKRRVYDRRVEDNPIVICGEGLADEVCQADNASPEVMIAGVEVVTSILSGPRRDFEPGDIKKGLPYVIVSHGQNGHGAVNHRASGTVSIHCRYPTNDPDHRGAPNKTYDVDDQGNRPFYDEAVNFPQIGLLGEDGMEKKWKGCSEVEHDGTALVNGFFVHKPRHYEGERHYDDIVVWVTASDLIRELTLADVFPVPASDLLPVFRGYILNRP